MTDRRQSTYIQCPRCKSSMCETARLFGAEEDHVYCGNCRYDYGTVDEFGKKVEREVDKYDRR